MITQIIKNLPLQAQTRVLMALIANTNARLSATARQELAIANRDHPLFARNTGDKEVGTEPNIDEETSALAEAEARFESERIRIEQGHNTTSPAKDAELLVSFREDLLAHYHNLCEENGIRPLDQSFAPYIDWQLNAKFMMNMPKAKAMIAASKGRVTLEKCSVAQKKRFEADKARLVLIAEPLLKTCEDLMPMDEENLATLLGVETVNEITTDAIFKELPALTKLGTLNAMWKKIFRLIEEDYPSGSIPSRDMESDITLLGAAEDEVIKLADQVHEACSDEYVTRLNAGLGEYEIVRQIEVVKNTLAKASAKPMTPLVVPSRRLVKKVEALATAHSGTTMADAALDATK